MRAASFSKRRAVVLFLVVGICVLCALAIYYGRGTVRQGSQLDVAEDVGDVSAGYGLDDDSGGLGESEGGGYVREQETEVVPTASGSSCPFHIDEAEETLWRESPIGSSWTFLSKGSVEDVAASLLVQFEEGGWHLLEAGYMGLGKDSWGCVAKDPGENGAVVIFAVPQVLGEARDEENLLQVNILRLYAVA